MIISHIEALQINEDIEEEDLKAIEISIRNKTNNNFQNTRIRYMDIVFIDDKTIGVDSKVIGLNPGDTIQINYSGYNDGLYVIKSIMNNYEHGANNHTITFEPGSFTELDLEGAMLTKIEYPADVKASVRDLIKHDMAMQDKKGIKSESISRWSATYEDSDYPESYADMLKSYEKMRW